jgi:hypothetical protein
MEFYQLQKWRTADLYISKRFLAMLGMSFVIAAWRVRSLRMKETASRYVEQLRIILNKQSRTANKGGPST